MRAALIQICAGDDPAANLPETLGLVDRAVAGGAGFVLTPEVTNCVSTSRTRQGQVLRREAEDETLEAMRDAARRHRIWMLIGSLALKTDDPDGRFANRSFLIGPSGEIAARYDKIHMFDVEIGPGESFRESEGFRPGDRAVVAHTPFGDIGLSICYDLRFPHLYRALAGAGARILTVPAAFAPTTGAAHWEVLLRARAIENGAWVLAPAQTGDHRASRGRPRHTYGHSMVVSPWGEVVSDAGTGIGVSFADLDIARVDEARRRIPSLSHTRAFAGP